MFYYEKDNIECSHFLSSHGNNLACKKNIQDRITFIIYNGLPSSPASTVSKIGPRNRSWCSYRTSRILLQNNNDIKLRKTVHKNIPFIPVCFVNTLICIEMFYTNVSIKKQFTTIFSLLTFFSNFIVYFNV